MVVLAFSKAIVPLFSRVASRYDCRFLPSNFAERCSMKKVGVLGASGYTALELIKLLLRHPEVEIVAATSRQEGNPHIGSVHPQLADRLDLCLEQANAADLVERCDVIFSCLPHAASAASVADILKTDTKVVDFSADYRLWDAALYTKWYGNEHPDPDRLGKVPYGLPELYREKIKTSQVVANPGCYPTSAILAMMPLLRAGLVIADELIFDSKSGVSGAGRKPGMGTHYPECNESVRAYGVGSHRHMPEIAQILSTSVKGDISVLFTPHLLPMDRGILTTGYARAGRAATSKEVMEAMQEFYKDEPFVRVVDDFPSTKSVAHTNYCDVTARVVGDRVVTISCIDNLIKGASGAAVQNMNLMFGWAETTALF